MLLIFKSSMNKNKGHSKIECPLHWCGKWDLNPHANTDTSTSSLPVCRFQHPRKSACLLYQIILHLSSTKIYIFVFLFYAVAFTAFYLPAVTVTINVTLPKHLSSARRFRPRTRFPTQNTYPSNRTR